MVDALTVDDFRPHVGETYEIGLADGIKVNLKLVEVIELGPPGPDPGAPPEAELDQFSLVLSGPPEPMLEQQTYEFQGPGSQAFELFVVPIGPDPTGTTMHYHVAFA